MPAIPSESGVSNRDLRSAPLLARGCGTRLYPGSSPTDIRRGRIHTAPSFLRKLGINRVTILELPKGAYRGVACWHSDLDWLIQAEIAYDLFYPVLRTLVCDKKGRGGCGREAFRKVCAARASAADWDTGRNSRLAVETIQAMTGLSEATVQRASRLMKAFGLATEVFRGRQRTKRERLASWRVKDRSRGWASVYALHPPNNPQVTARKFEIDPLPNTSVTPHPRRGPVRAPSPLGDNSLHQTGTAGSLKSRASRDPSRTQRARQKRKQSPPDPRGLLLARNWLHSGLAPSWAERVTITAWGRVLAPLAGHHWTPADLHALLRDHRGLPYVAANPHKPIALMNTLIARYRDLDDLACPPAYYDQQREAEAATRRSAIATCSACGEDGYRLDDVGLPIEPVVRCTHSSVPGVMVMT